MALLVVDILALITNGTVFVISVANNQPWWVCVLWLFATLLWAISTGMAFAAWEEQR